MSTKIYNAFRVKRAGDLWPVLRDIYRQGTANVTAAINNTYDATGIAIGRSTLTTIGV